MDAREKKKEKRNSGVVFSRFVFLLLPEGPTIPHFKRVHYRVTPRMREVETGSPSICLQIALSLFRAEPDALFPLPAMAGKKARPARYRGVAGRRAGQRATMLPRRGKWTRCGTARTRPAPCVGRASTISIPSERRGGPRVCRALTRKLSSALGGGREDLIFHNGDTPATGVSISLRDAIRFLDASVRRSGEGAAVNRVPFCVLALCRSVYTLLRGMVIPPGR